MILITLSLLIGSDGVFLNLTLIISSRLMLTLFSNGFGFLTLEIVSEHDFLTAGCIDGFNGKGGGGGGGGGAKSGGANSIDFKLLNLEPG